jgi:hypothetical protein
MIGGDAWGHWVAVRGRESDGTLILENPARGYKSIFDQLRDSFSALGPFGMVVIETTSAGRPAQAPVAPPSEAMVTIPRARLDLLETLVGVAYHDDGEVLKSLAIIRDAVDSVIHLLRLNNPAKVA